MYLKIQVYKLIKVFSQDIVLKIHKILNIMNKMKNYRNLLKKLLINKNNNKKNRILDKIMNL